MANPPKDKAKAKPAAAKKPAPRSGKAVTRGAKAKPVDSGQKYLVSGTVTYADSTPAVGLTVIAYDGDESGTDKLGSAATDQAGNYTIRYSEADFRKTKKERGGADVIVCVYDADKTPLYTSKKKNNAPANYELNIKLPPQPFVVRGTVTDANHKPLANLTVRAFERDLRHPQFLGTTTTDTNGDYRIEYHLSNFLLGEVPARRTPWLIVEVLEAPDGQVLAKQEVQRATYDQTVLFTLTNVGVVSEWQRISEAVAPLLKGQGTQAVATRVRANNGNEKTDLHPADLTATDVDFIVLETGLDRAAVQAWATSSKMLRDAHLQLTDEYPAQQAALRENGGSFFFGIARQGRVTDLDAVLRESAESLNQALKAAVSAHRIPPLNEKQVEVLLAVLKLLQGLQQLDPARSGNSDFARVLASLSTPLPKIVALDALTIVQQKGLDDVEALLELTKRHPDAEASIKTFVRGVRVHQLASGDEGLSRALNARLEGGASDSIAPLAAMISADWISVANETSTSPGQALRMLAHVEKQHPLTALQAKFIVGNVTLPGVTGGEIAALIKNDGVMVAAILQGKKRVKDTDAKAPAVHKKLRDLGRFMRTGVSMELGADLMNADIGTPGKALRYGREYIYKKHRERLPKETAREITDSFFDTTERTVNGGMAVMLEVDINRASPARFWQGREEYKLPLPKKVRENLPSLPGFFGDLDECICRPCESMLGQPAYLVDLLNLLRKSKGAYEALDRRRPDIPELKLDCENSETPIQHIDIVLEILEKATANAAANTPQDVIHGIAYDQLARAVFPWNLPLDLFRARATAYLAKLGVSRSNLLSLRVASTSEQLTVETLSISKRQTAVGGIAVSEWKLLTEQRTGTDLWAAYGFRQTSGLTIIDPASREQLENKTVQDLLKRVSVLLDRTGLTLEQLEQVLETKFINGDGPTLALTNRTQCKTSEMDFPSTGTGATLEVYLDRLHRFVRLRAKFPDWSIEQLGAALVALGGVETGQTADAGRKNLMGRWATIKRLQLVHGLPIEALIRLPASIANLRQAMGLSALQFNILKEITAFDPALAPFNWAALEDFCNAAKRIADSELSIEQVAEALLTRDQLASLLPTLPQSIKTDEQIETLLRKIQSRLREAVAGQAEQAALAGETQVAAALTQIFDEPTARDLVNAIRDAGAELPVVPVAPIGQPRAELLRLLTTSPAVAPGLGEWSRLLSDTQAARILDVTPSNNLGADTRFEVLLSGIATSRLQRDFERTLISAISEECDQSEADASLLLGSRLLLTPVQNQPLHAYEVFLAPSFWRGDTAPPVTRAAMERLYAWMERLYRLVALSDALKLDSELMRLADRASVGSGTGINWRDLLAAAPPETGRTWSNQHWKALLDLVWLQQPEQISRPVLADLWGRLTRLPATPTTAQIEEALHPLALRVALPAEERIEGFAAQAIAAVTAVTLRNPTELRKVFALLLQVRHLRASAAQLDQLANLVDNSQAATVAKALLDARLSEQSLSEKELKEVMRKIEDPLRQQKRDALVAYLVRRDENDKWKSANDLYEHYLIDPKMEPCFDTTQIVEAITATQLFMQRILFGLEEGVIAGDDLKKHWIWMRNYRVWEANRKVFLFPENWLFPELRDDKSSSFKQLESALGQGELNQDLANQSFGQFLDDVAQMGQIEVLGMYEDISRNTQGQTLTDSQNIPRRRTLYVIGRTQNPPYAYFWRHCVDFGSPYMEWSPWQRIELDVQGDHVMPFVLGGQLYIAWPLIRSIKIGSGEAEKDGWEVKLAWSRHDGKSWRKSSVSRDFWSGEAAAFTDERRGFAFRSETALDDSKATIFVYAIADKREEVKHETTKVLSTTPGIWGNETYPGTATNINNAYEFLNRLILDSYGLQDIPPVIFKVGEYPATCPDDGKLPCDIKRQIFLYAHVALNFGRGADHSASDGLLKKDPLLWGNLGGRMPLFSYRDLSLQLYTQDLLYKYPRTTTNPITTTIIPSPTEIKDMVVRFLWAFWGDEVTSRTGTTEYFDAFYEALKRVSSRRIVHCHARIKLTAPDSTNTTSYLELDGSVGSYTCTIDSEYFTLPPNGTKELSWKLGAQPEITCTLTLALNKISAAGVRTTVTLQSSIDTPGIDQGYVTTQHLYFEFDGLGHTAIEIGFDLDAFKFLKPVAKFLLTRDDMVSKSPPLTPQNKLFNPVFASQPWMNGFREIAPMGDAAPVGPLNIDALNPAHRANIFYPTKAGQFWAVGAATSKREEAFDVEEEIPAAWHFAESDRGGYIDLGYRVGLADSGFRVYPDAYPEATLRRSDWSQSRTLPVAQNQISDFGAKNLPIPANDSSTRWTDVVNGLYTFDARLPYACYNWEVFFHAPLLIADQLSKQHKFEDAERWLRYVFDPTSPESVANADNAKRFLKFRVFKDLDLSKQVIDDLTVLAQVAGGFGTASDDDAVEKMIKRWRDAPFRPFQIARGRHIAFLWRTLFAYLDNLIAWADSLYRRDTRESINEATMLYVLAERILGRRPQLHQGKSNRDSVTYEEVMTKWDDFANYWIDVGTQGRSNRPTAWREIDSIKQPNPDGMLYFCMPFNDKILSYWNTIEARLSNVRNCRNIEGIKRSLPLMDAEIDPELLIRATAAGLDLGDVIAGLYAPPPHYRYSILSARAAELANEAKSLGAAMLSAIEKRDAEHLAKLRSSNEISLLKLVSEVRKLQITEADRNIDALRGSRKSIGARYDQYQRLLGIKDANAPEEGKTAGEVSMLGRVGDGTSGLSHLGLIDAENKHIEDLDIAYGWTVAGGVTKGVAGAAHMSAGIVRANSAGVASVASEVLTSIGTGLSTVGDMFDMVSRGWQHSANRQSILGGHLRRRDEWAFQSNQTLKEMQQIDKQILANQIRIDITNKELNNHIEQIEQSKAVDEVMRSKFSNEQLYEWMKTELSKLYFSAYRMALEMARKAERAAARELGVKPLNILGNAYWDSLRDGLLAGERLHQDLKRLEITYLDQNRREYELTKHISLRRLDPKALVELRAKDATGRCRCEFKIPEWLFDLDTPGHYLRRIKSVSVSIPSVTGPFTSVSCKLTLLKSQVRHKPSLKESSRYLRLVEGDDDRFTDYFGASEAIVTSTGTGDSGLFETNLRDERFLPFEGSGVISEWRLELPDTYPQFDYSTISDVVLSIRYTAREAGDPLRAAATSSISTLFTPTPPPPATPLRFPVLFSCRSDFPTEWSRARAGGGLKIKISSDFFPYWVTAITPELSVQKVESFDVVKGLTNPSSWTLTPANKYTVTPDGDVEAELPTVSSTVTDRIVLLSVGTQ